MTNFLSQIIALSFLVGFVKWSEVSAQETISPEEVMASRVFTLYAFYLEDVQDSEDKSEMAKALSYEAFIYYAWIEFKKVKDYERVNIAMRVAYDRVEPRDKGFFADPLRRKAENRADGVSAIGISELELSDKEYWNLVKKFRKFLN